MNKQTKILGLTATSMLLLPLAAFANPPQTYQAIDVVDIEGINTEETTPVRTGAATLRRTKNGVEGRVMTNVSTVGFPYTVWWVVFNNPEHCKGPFIRDADGNDLTRCNGPDTRDPDVGGGVFYASGAISQSTDKINMMGYPIGVFNSSFGTSGGERPEGECCRGALVKNNGFGAEIHLVVARHDGIAANGSWVTDLTTPGMNHRAAVFLAVPAHDENDAGD